MTELMVQPVEAAAVRYNKSEMAAAIAAIASRYEGRVVIDKASAKRDRAEVNKMLREVDDARKAVKRAYEAPYKAFEAELREILEPLKLAGDAIDAQIKAIEQAEREERRAALEAVWDTTEHSVPISRVFDIRWLNASVSLKKATDELAAAAAAAEADVQCIRDLHSQYEAVLIDMYANGETLASVMSYKARMEAQAMPVPEASSDPHVAIGAQLTAENPLNVYNVRDAYIEVGAPKRHHTISLNCTDVQLDRVCSALDELGLFFVVD